MQPTSQRRWPFSIANLLFLSPRTSQTLMRAARRLLSCASLSPGSIKFSSCSLTPPQQTRCVLKAASVSIVGHTCQLDGRSAVTPRLPPAVMQSELKELHLHPTASVSLKAVASTSRLWSWFHLSSLDIGTDPYHHLMLAFINVPQPTCASQQLQVQSNTTRMLGSAPIDQHCEIISHTRICAAAHMSVCASHVTPMPI